MPSYYVSGIIQMTVQAKTAKAAVVIALSRQESLMKKWSSLNISLDNISDTKSLDAFNLDDAGVIDEPEHEDLPPTGGGQL